MSTIHLSRIISPPSTNSYTPVLSVMVNNQDLFKRRGDGGPDELFWEESDNIFTDLKTKLLEDYKPVS